jgi:hypothetical protein
VGAWNTVPAMFRTKFTRLKTLYGTAGPRETGVVVGLTLGCYALALKVLQIVALSPEDLDSDFLHLERELRAGFADPPALLAAATRDPSLELTPDFVRAAAARGDRCYAIWSRDRLVSYGWYSNRPTDIGDGLTLRFNPRFTYMYKGYTTPEFRGRRLHGIGMARALAGHAAAGSLGLVSYVERTNTASLRSVYRLGFRDAGRVITTSIFGKVIAHAGVSRPDLAIGVQRAPP